jgi:hypothetical protein
VAAAQAGWVTPIFLFPLYLSSGPTGLDPEKDYEKEKKERIHNDPAA